MHRRRRRCRPETAAAAPRRGLEARAAAAPRRGLEARAAAARAPVNPAQCKKEVFATCVREQIQSCSHDAVKEFVGDKDNLRFLFDPPVAATGTGSGGSGGSSGNAATMEPASGSSNSGGGGCSTVTGIGVGGLVLVGAALTGSRLRRRRRAA